jgi:hypothetical protein
MKKTIAFRLLALSQMSYEAGCYVRDASKRHFGGAPNKSVIVTAADGTPFREMQVTQGQTLSDLLPSCKELLQNSVLRGHVNPYLFCGVSCDSYPELYDKNAVADNRRLLRIAIGHAWGIAEMGARRSAYLPPYVASQLEHLTECQECIDAVLRFIRKDLRTRNALDGLLERAGLIRGSASFRP